MIDRQLKLRGLLDRQFGWSVTLQNPMHEPRAAPKQARQACAICHKATSLDTLLRLIHGGQTLLCYKIDNLPNVLQDKTVVDRDKSVRLSLHHCSKCVIKLITCAQRNGNQLEAQCRNSDDELFQEGKI